MLTFVQGTGEVLYKGAHFCWGYAGNGAGKNNPAMQNVKSVGPLPCGRYKVKPARLSTRLGPITLNLEPDPANEMFGRDLFRIHGEVPPPALPGHASDGCIVLGHWDRLKIEAIRVNGDDDLEVIAVRREM